MKPFVPILIVTALLGWCAEAATTISTANKFSHAANFGWMDWRGDGTSGAVIGAYACSGWVFAANIGWINLGSGSPANSIQYQNNSATDFGVNLTAGGKLRGYAYGANIGWINFENTGDPRIDLLTGKFEGYLFSANCGWIALDTVFAHVQTDFLLPAADANGDGLPDAWQLTATGTLADGPNADTDGDGATHLEEYLAGTDPNDPHSTLAVTHYTTAAGGAPTTLTTLTWQSVMTRFYFIEQSLDLVSWFDSGLGPIPPAGPTTTDAFTHPHSAKRFFRVRAVNPLAP
jgi:hypothetical protein